MTSLLAAGFRVTRRRRWRCVWRVRRCPIDIGKANEHWFLNVASVGFGAEVTATTPPELKRLLGPAAYAVMGAILAINVHHYHGRLTLPDREITGSGPVAIVGNGRQTGGGVQVAPRAHIDDGLLDVLVVRQIPAMRYSPPRESCKSFHRMASISPTGKLRGPRFIPKKRFRSTSMANRCSFQVFDMKRCRGDSADCSAELSITIGNQLKSVAVCRRPRQFLATLQEGASPAKTIAPCSRKIRSCQAAAGVADCGEQSSPHCNNQSRIGSAICEAVGRQRGEE